MKRRHGKLAGRYMIASFSVVLIAGIVVGMVLYALAAEGASERERDRINEQLSLIAQDLDAQYHGMQTVWANISSEICFRRVYLERSRFYEIEMLEALSKYRFSTILTEDFFLCYKGDQYIYKPSGKCTMEIYLNSIGLDTGDVRLLDEIENVSGFSIIEMSDRNAHLFVFPIYLGTQSVENDADLCFVVRTNDFRKRAEVVAGSIAGEISFIDSSNNIFAVFGETGRTPDYSAEITSPSGQFTVRLCAAESVLLSNANPFQTIHLLSLSLAAILLVLMGLYLGYRLYRPIGRLSSKYAPSNPAEKLSEIENIEIAFQDLNEQKVDAERHIQTQYRLLKKQYLQLLLSGNVNPAFLQRQSFVGVLLPGPLWSVIAVSFEDGSLSEDEFEETAAQIEELSDDEIRFYFSGTHDESVYAVIASLPDTDAESDAVDYVKAVLSERRSVRIGAARCCDTPDKFKEMLNRSIDFLERSSQTEPIEAADDIYLEKDVLNPILSAIRNGDDHAGQQIELLVTDIHKRIGEFMKERFLYDQILHRLAEEFREDISATQNETLLRRIIKTSDFDEFLYLMTELIRSLSEWNMSERTVHIRQNRVDLEEILRFIEDNYADSDLSLDVLSDHFGLSTRYISRVIKQETDSSYKDYLINLRMEKAKEILSGGMTTVTEAAIRVGYTHLPLFIKSFKKKYGCTPSAIHEEGEEKNDGE